MPGDGGNDCGSSTAELRPHGQTSNCSSETPPDAPDHGFDGTYAIIETIVDGWEALMEIEHPLGQIMRMTAS